MEQGWMEFNKSSIAVIGAGPAGCMCAYFASQNKKENEVTLFDFSSPLNTLLYTGGGRCNLAYAEYDFKELADFYPRGKKFLYSVFSRFSTADTIDFFNSLGVKTYARNDLRIFPVSNSAKEVREKFLSHLKSCEFKKEKVINIIKEENKFLIQTENNDYYFDKVVIAIGGHSAFFIAENLGHKIIAPKPALTGLITQENFQSAAGVSLKNIKAQIFWESKKFAPCLEDDLLFTHSGISGPLAYKVSSICARLPFDKKNPLIVKLNFLEKNIDFQSMLNAHPKKDLKNLISDFIPKSLVEYIMKQNTIALDVKCHEADSGIRDLIFKSLTEFEININSTEKEGEIVTSGGVSLDEINPKTMQSKLMANLYFCGEVIDIDGFCGGFNLQNCWSTGFAAGKTLQIN